MNDNAHKSLWYGLVGVNTKINRFPVLSLITFVVGQLHPGSKKGQLTVKESRTYWHEESELFG